MDIERLFGMIGTILSFTYILIFIGCFITFIIFSVKIKNISDERDKNYNKYQNIQKATGYTTFGMFILPILFGSLIALIQYITM